MTRSELFRRLADENISLRPDDGEALSIIERYINDYDCRQADKTAGAETAKLMERIREQDLAIDPAADDAERAYIRAAGAISSALTLLECQVDEWGARGLLRDFAFSYSESERRYAVESFISLCSRMGRATREMSAVSGTSAAAATRLRECASSALMLATELKYASYAARLVGMRDDSEEYLEMSETVRRTAMTAERLSAELHRAMRALSVSLSAISSALGGASAALGIDDGIDDDNDAPTAKDPLSGSRSVLIYPKRAAAALSAAVASIRAVRSDSGLDNVSAIGESDSGDNNII